MEEKNLIHQFQKGDKSAFDKLVHRHQEWVRLFILKTVGHKEDAEDIAQDVFVKSYFGLSKFRMESEFNTWLYRIVINHINNYFRKKKLLSWFSHDLQESNTPEPTAIEENQVSELLQHIRKLPRIQRNVMVLRTYQDLPFKEIGNVLSISENSAKVSFHKAKVNLKKFARG
ncbi:MAG: sigma-70 family RNA polymerase sigma factor [Candidatus Marinimicrobia bacterium]|nr:sigma-70 family RNA polymerase sigma factor [Candidatus Neomarinimicrobiota bacterium]MBL7023602.1 sigma-70 family RNA polymerase sigma factor [Candidatus Neomarinimicrobiota bacterium]MBL7109900.1 sigma-70 family RNA polymerase sigma factor [Candidatus Neomarinimicrobiota bacterium]